MAKQKNQEKDLYGSWDLFSLADAHPELYNDNDLGLILQKGNELDNKIQNFAKISKILIKQCKREIIIYNIK